MKKVFEDEFGNKLFVREIKTRGSLQYSAKNVEGKLVDLSGLKSLIKKFRNTTKGKSKTK